MTILDQFLKLFLISVLLSNKKPFMNEELCKAITKRSRLRNVYLNSRKNSDQHAWKQRNFVTNLLRKTRKSYFESAVNNTFHNSHEFWKVCKPFFSNNSSISDSKILLVCNDNILNDDAEVASAFKSHFKEITKNLDISQWVSHPMCPTFSNPVYKPSLNTETTLVLSKLGLCQVNQLSSLSQRSLPILCKG